MNRNKITSALVLGVLLLGGCNKSPFERTRDASGGGPLGAFGSGRLVVFSDELKTGGGAFLYPAGDNQVLDFRDTSNPLSQRSIRYNWTGQDVNGQHLFAGFDLMHAIFFNDYNTTPGRDLRQAGYTKVTFYARGSLSSDTLVKIEVSEPNTSATCISLSMDGTLDDGWNPGSTACSNLGRLSGSWQQFSISVPNSAQGAIKDFFKATLIFNAPLGNTGPGQGGTVYFDQIQFEP